MRAYLGTDACGYMGSHLLPVFAVHLNRCKRKKLGKKGLIDLHENDLPDIRDKNWSVRTYRPDIVIFN